MDMIYLKFQNAFTKLGAYSTHEGRGGGVTVTNKPAQES